MKRGQIFRANLEPRSGSEQRGWRPVLVVSHDAFNRAEAWRSVLVVSLSTSPRQRERGPTAVLLPAGAGGLLQPSVALCHQVTTLDRGKLEEELGTLPDDLLRQVERGLMVALGIL